MSAVLAAEGGDGPTTPAVRRRKGARTRAEIPPDVLRALNEGTEETVTLVEILAIDRGALARRVCAELDLDADTPVMAAAAASSDGFGAHQKQIGAAFAALAGAPGSATFERLARHRSDVARSWAAYAVGALALPFRERLGHLRRFAADPHMSVRECAWDAFRPQLIRELEGGLRLLEAWAWDADPNVRRAAVEGTRPRGVWTHHIEPLKADPDLGLPILEPVRADASRYVQTAAGNWLNDASKTRPGWVRALVERWERDSPREETRWILRHGTRTLRR